MHCSPYGPQGNGQIEASHKLLIRCIRKFTMKDEVEWDKVLNIACTAYNCFPNSQSQESGFFLTFGRDVYITTSSNLLQPNLECFGHTFALLSLEMLRGAYILAAMNLKMARDRKPSKDK